MPQVAKRVRRVGQRVPRTIPLSVVPPSRRAGCASAQARYPRAAPPRAAPPHAPRVAVIAAAAWGTRWMNRGGIPRQWQVIVQVFLLQLAPHAGLGTGFLRASPLLPGSAHSFSLFDFVGLFYFFPFLLNSPSLQSSVFPFSAFSLLLLVFVSPAFFLPVPAFFFPCLVPMVVLLVNKISASRWCLISDPQTRGTYGMKRQTKIKVLK